MLALPGPAVAGRTANRWGAALNLTVLYTAAHGGFQREKAPLGGGAAVFEHLLAEWQRTRPFELQAITPSILGANAPSGSDLTAYDESRYAAFSRAFESASTQEILRHDPARTVVLANDISEGPNFRALATRGFRVFTIFHVDVVDYVTNLYGRGWLAPETTVRWFPRLRWMLPEMASLVWDKQQAVVEASRGLIVPSAGMRDVLLRCYPECPPAKIHVLPWGNWHAATPADPASVTALRREFQVPVDASVVLTLSRISPEKGQDLLLESLLEWEHRGDLPSQPLYVFICGDAAFMQGQRHMAKLRALAAKLRRIRAIFPGHVTGDRKRAFFELADLYVFPSRHESYGLTLLEAMAAGLPSVCLDTHGARSVMRPEFGAIVDRRNLAQAIARLLSDPVGRARMGNAAKAFAERQNFAERAVDLSKILER
ncbi:MAG: glycosyltransferase family 4 protein [Acidobacteriota bacterium]